MKNKKKLITVFTVNWNGKKWLEKFLKSLEAQTYNNLEILVVDNNSTDDSVSYVQKNFPQVKIVQNSTNVGLAKATNIGVENSKGHYVLFINNDTWFEPDFIQMLVDYYEKNDYFVVSAIEKRYFDNEEFICNTTIDITGSPAFYIPTLSRKDKIFYLTVCFFCSKKDFVDTGRLDENFYMYYEDVDWFWRLTLLGKKFGYVPKCYIHHAGAGSTGSGLKYSTFLWRNQNTLQALIKNYSLPILILSLPLYILQNIAEIIFFVVLLKPRFALTYIQGWVFIAKNLRSILKKRRNIQKSRVVSDLEILKKMYWGSGKILLLNHFYKSKMI
jgi:GT2 family glycosyltransferase